MWAKIVARYVSEYEKEGIKISRLTVQNEPNATQTWDSCLFTGSEEQEYVCNYLRAALDQEGHNDVKINVWDHNKERVLDRALESLSTEEAERKLTGSRSTGIRVIILRHLQRCGIVSRKKS